MTRRTLCRYACANRHSGPPLTPRPDSQRRFNAPADGLSGLVRVLRNRDVLVLGFGAMIGWSWVLMTGFWVTTAGSLGTLAAFAAGGLAIALIGLTYSELVSAMPEAGGEHVYTHRGLGSTWSFVCTWALLLAYLNVCLFESVALPTAVEYLVPQIRLGTLWHVLGADVDLGFVLVGIAGAVTVTVVNVLGIKAAARLQAATLTIIIISGVLLVTGAISFGTFQRAEPWIALPATGILTVLIMVPALLVGFDVIPQSAEEIDLPPARIGTLLVVSVVLAVLWYALVSFSVAMALDGEALAVSTMATGDAATALWGHPAAGALLVLGGVAGIMTSWNAFVIGASRLLLALARSGMVSAVFARLHSRYHTPWVGIVGIGGLCCVAPFFGRTVLVWLINAGGFATMLAYLFVPIAFLVLRRLEPDMPRPFRVRHPRLVGYAAIALAVALLLAYLPGSPSALTWPYEWLTIVIWSVLGLALLVRLHFRATAADRHLAVGTDRS
jgi:basic amino acid/polyamine antiporter, APA family